MCIKVEILTHNIHLSPHYSVHFSFSKIRPWKIFWLIVQFQHWFICKASCILSKLWWTSVEGMLVQHIVGGPEVEQASDSLPSLVLRSPSLHWRRSAGTDSCNSTRQDWVSHFAPLNRYSDAVSLKKGFWFLLFQLVTSSEPWFERVKLLLSSVDCYTSEYFCSFALPWMKRSQQPQTASTRSVLNGFTRPVTVHTFATYIVIKQQIVVV